MELEPSNVALQVLSLNAATTIVETVNCMPDQFILADALEQHLSLRELRALEQALKNMYRKIVAPEEAGPIHLPKE